VITREMLRYFHIFKGNNCLLSRNAPALQILFREETVRILENAMLEKIGNVITHLVAKECTSTEEIEIGIGYFCIFLVNEG